MKQPEKIGTSKRRNVYRAGPENMSVELLQIVHDYKSVVNCENPDGKKFTQDRAEKELLQAVNNFIDSDKYYD